MQERKKEGASLYVTYDSMKRPVHISIKESGLSGFLAFMREDTAEVLRQGYDPNLWMCHYRFPDRRQIPEIRPQSNDDYLERLSRAARSAGIRAEHQIAMTDMLYCLRHSIVPLTPEADPAKLALRTDYPDPLGTFGVELPSPGIDIPEYRAYTAVETAPGVVFFSDTQHGKMQFEKYMDYHASNFFNPEQQTPSLKIYDVIARPADMAPITDRCFAEAEDGQERRNRFAEAYADRELLRQGNLRREFDMRRSTENYYAFLLRDEPAGEKKKRLADRSFRELWERFREGGRLKEPAGPECVESRSFMGDSEENAPDTKTINAYEYTSHSGDGPADPRSGPDGEPRADLHGRFYPEGFRPVCRRRYFRRAKRSRRTSGRMDRALRLC